jgi:hypothetical protein
VVVGSDYIKTFNFPETYLSNTKEYLIVLVSNYNPSAYQIKLNALGDLYGGQGMWLKKSVWTKDIAGYPVMQLVVNSEPSAAIDVIQTTASGFLDKSFLYNVNLGNNIISGISSTAVSTDLANKAYVDSVKFQDLYNQDPDGSNVTITTNSIDGALVIEGTEKLQVTASSGVYVSNALTAGSSLSAGSLVAGNASMSVSAAGNLTKISGCLTACPQVKLQAITT